MKLLSVVGVVVVVGSEAGVADGDGGGEGRVDKKTLIAEGAHLETVGDAESASSGYSFSINDKHASLACIARFRKQSIFCSFVEPPDRFGKNPQGGGKKSPLKFYEAVQEVSKCFGAKVFVIGRNKFTKVNFGNYMVLELGL
ncbi:unnamed protein product [Schistocephalus solidus]|uniref:Secreted protein n=1 Tax=Schistocephalus solidus TaxID=70667 RepID=A0A183TRF6_SCHSO|nr:unnamed protein product [Schistocephalus solidus]